MSFQFNKEVVEGVSLGYSDKRTKSSLHTKGGFLETVLNLLILGGGQF